jgi:hypothetical protein
MKEVKELAAEWRGQTLESFYPVLFLDALRVNIRDGSVVFPKTEVQICIVRNLVEHPMPNGERFGVLIQRCWKRIS